MYSGSVLITGHGSHTSHVVTVTLHCSAILCIVLVHVVLLVITIAATIASNHNHHNYSIAVVLHLILP